MQFAKAAILMLFWPLLIRGDEDCSLDQWCESKVDSKSTTTKTVIVNRSLLDRGQLSFYFELLKHPKNSPPVTLTVLSDSQLDFSASVPFNFTVEESQKLYFFTNNFINKTLCPTRLEDPQNLSRGKGKLAISVVVSSTGRPQPQGFRFLVSKQPSFYLNLSNEIEIETAVFAPKILKLNLPLYSTTKDGYVMVTAESTDDQCMSVSYQTALCPRYVYDTKQVDLKDQTHFVQTSLKDMFVQKHSEDGILIHQTAGKKASRIFAQETFEESPSNGIYVVVVLKPNDRTCSLNASFGDQKSATERKKKIKIKFQTLPVNRTNFMIGTVMTTGFFLMIGVGVVSFYVVFLKRMVQRQPVMDNRTVTEDSASIDSAETFLTVPEDPTPKDTTTDGKYELGLIFMASTLSLLSARNLYLHVQLNDEQGSCNFNEQCAFRFGKDPELKLSVSNVSYVVLGAAFIGLTFIRSKGKFKKGLNFILKP